MKKATRVTTRWSLCPAGVGRVYTVWFASLRFLLCGLWLYGGLLFVASSAQAAVKAGDILVVDRGGGTGSRGALFVVNPKTGQRIVLSDFGNPKQGKRGSGDFDGGLASVAVGQARQIFVTDMTAGDPVGGGLHGGVIFLVKPRTGKRTVVSDFGQGEIQGLFYYGLAVDAKGRVIVNLDRSGLPAFGPRAVVPHFALVRVDPKTDERVLITDLTNPEQGVTEFDRRITDLAIERSGKILIGTATQSGFLNSAIFRVRSVTGNRKLLSDFANATQGADAADLSFTTGLAIETSGQILVASGGGYIAAPRNLLLRIDPKTGQRTVLSDFDKRTQGPLGAYLYGVAVEKSEAIVVGASKNLVTPDTYSLFQVNPQTGQRTLLSDADDPTQGTPFMAVTYIAIVPEDSDAEGHD